MYHKRFFLHVPTRSSKAQLEGAVNSANKRREWVRYILADMRTSKRIGEGSLQAGRDEPLHTQPLCVCVCVGFVCVGVIVYFGCLSACLLILQPTRLLLVHLQACARQTTAKHTTFPVQTLRTLFQGSSL